MQTKPQNNPHPLKYSSLVYPILAGFFGFTATAIGAHFFNLVHQYYYIAIGLALFLLSNHLLYKFKFNSYHQNGSTVTTILVFTSQVVSMAVYKMEDIGWKWVVGVILILAGTLLIESAKPNKQLTYGTKEKNQKKNKEKQDSNRNRKKQ